MNPGQAIQEEVGSQTSDRMQQSFRRSAVFLTQDETSEAEDAGDY